MCSSHSRTGSYAVYGARMRDPDGLTLELTGEVLHWRGPAPHHFVPVPEEQSALIRELSSAVSYGWGVIPVSACIGATTFSTSLFPKDGRYLVPVKTAVRAAEDIAVGDVVTLRLTLSPSR